jgi:L-alanine-DL-glutamate epimerase-like enolase superfamily enzyme
MEMRITKRTGLSRRTFLASIGGLPAIIGMKDHLKNDHVTSLLSLANQKSTPIKIKTAKSNFEREPLKRPFGFKGGFMTEKWQTAVMLETDSGVRAVGIGSPSVLWADSSVFASWSEAAGNSLLYAILDFAVQYVKGKTYENPIELMDHLFPLSYEFGKKVTGNNELRETFILMALVPLDNAAWMVYAKENRMETFDQMIPKSYRDALSYQHKQVACIPLFSYTTPINEIRDIVLKGYFLLKIKIGQPGSQQKMLEKDKLRIKEIHQAIGHITTPHTKDKKLKYYLDANGRYQNKSTFLSLLSYIKEIGAFEQLTMVEEPFPENEKIDVGDLGVPIIADESAHTDKSSRQQIELGYKGFAIKPAGKTLSMSLKIMKLAFENNLPCFCADSTANPILVEWNKNVAARLKPIPGLEMGLVETNGEQNYAHWDQMMSYHPCSGASWTIAKNGVFNLTEKFYRNGGCIFESSEHYWKLFQ